jgi:hypothetical protein
MTATGPAITLQARDRGEVMEPYRLRGCQLAVVRRSDFQFCFMAAAASAPAVYAG